MYGFFSDSLSRLKHYLRVSKDQEVAAALGQQLYRVRRYVETIQRNEEEERA